MQDFSSLGLPEQLLNSLKILNFTTPTPIQAKVIPDALKGRDILGSAQTGSGKTGAFGIPLIAKLMLDPKGSALVMTPTRELAVQVIKMLESLIGKKSDIKTALLIGGESITKQFQKLRARPRLIVGTPGRINDHIIRGTVKLDDVGFLVLDETDRMLDMGFTPQIDSILELVPEDRQTLLFSATVPKNIMSMSKKYLTDPLRIAIEEIAKPVSTLKQETLEVSEQDKYIKLLEELEKREGSIIIFVKTKMGVDRITKRLRQDDHSADAIHGDLSHNRREKAIAGFRMCKYRILVATDIASRGLDIPHIMHVINYDLPQCPEDYIHRIGRTARAGAEGSSLCFISPSDRGKWKIINNLINFGESPEQEMGNRNSSNRNGGNRSFGGRNSRDGGPRGAFGSRDGGPRGAFPSRDGGPRGSFGSRDGGPRGSFGSRDGGPRGAFPSRDAGPRGSFGSRDGASRGAFGSRDSGSKDQRQKFSFGDNRDFDNKSNFSRSGNTDSRSQKQFENDLGSKESFNNSNEEKKHFGYSDRQSPFKGRTSSQNPFKNQDNKKRTFRRTSPSAS